MRSLLPALALVALVASPAVRADEAFDALAGGAERLDSLETFLTRYVGRCTGVYERRSCEANVAALRRGFTGKKLAVRVTDAAPLVQPKLEGDRFLLLVTPFVDGNGLALTHGAPSGQDRSGSPRIGFIPIRGRLPPGMLDMEFQGPFRTGAIELEIVFRPEKTWKMPRRGDGGSYEGVAARFLAIRVIDARTGSEIAAKVL